MLYSLLVNLLKLIVVVGICVYVINYWVLIKNYTFSAEVIEKITLRHLALGKNVTSSFDDIYHEFHATYPGHILGSEHRQWMFMNCGGWMGAVHIIHASLTEYVLFFGTAINTSGNSGRYWANISDTILSGTFRQWQEGDLHSKLYGPGDTVYHYWGEAAAVDWTAGTWMVEYGRGFIPSTLGFALADTIFSTQDFVTLFYILRVYAHALTLEFGTFLSEMFLTQS